MKDKFILELNRLGIIVSKEDVTITPEAFVDIFEWTIPKNENPNGQMNIYKKGNNYYGLYDRATLLTCECQTSNL